MQNLFGQRCLGLEISRRWAALCLAASLAVLAGCGSGSGLSNSTTPGTTTGTTGTPTTPSAPTLTLALTNAAGAAVTSISVGAPATVKATLKNAAGAAVANSVVTFSTDATLATITPTATALTDGAGVATVTLNPATIAAAGAATITAAAQVETTAITGSAGFAVGVAAVTVAKPVLGVGDAPLSAFGTTSISVAVSLGGVPVTTPQNVTFSSSCASVGKAMLSTGVATVNGTATGSYRDNGCAGTDVITASAAGVTSTSTSLVVTPPTTGSIQFVSATPSIISLKGIGGTEASLVSFKVLDPAGKPLSGKTVTFDLSTRIGGVALTPSDPITGIGTAISDANGLVLINVNSGTVSTPIRVTASTVDTSTTPNTTLTTQSNGLTISTGIPDQDSLSLSATKVFVEDGNVDGATTVLTARLADHFNNPVPDGTVVNFITTGGAITASCSTKDSLCSSTLTVQDPRPTNGQVTVLAYAVGEESFIDRNGNGIADLASEMFDVNGSPTDMGEAYIESNGTPGYQLGEFFLDFNNNGKWDGPDGLYSGVLCNSTTSSLCPVGPPPTPKTIHVRRSGVIVFSDSTAVITRITPTLLPIDLGSCPGASSVTIRVVDKKNGNPMPTGTTITFNGGGGVVVAEPSVFTQDNTGATDYTVNINDSGLIACIGGTGGSGAITITVKTPAGVTTAPVTSYPVKLY